MRITTNDGLAGFLLSPAGMPQFYRFQLIVAGELVGDEDPCIAGSIFGPFRSISELDGERLGGKLGNAEELRVLLRADDQLNSATLRHFAESLDDWEVRAFSVGDLFILLATEDKTQRTLMTKVDISEFADILETLRFTWEREEQRIPRSTERQ